MGGQQPQHDPDDELLDEKEEDRPPRGRLAVGLSKVQVVVYTALVLTLIALGFLWPRIFISVPPGHGAVLYRYFHGGTVTERIWGEGLSVIPPWDKMTIYDLRLQDSTLKFDVL